MLISLHMLLVAYAEKNEMRCRDVKIKRCKNKNKRNISRLLHEQKNLQKIFGLPDRYSKKNITTASSPIITAHI
jgi:hypothetical protein